MFSTAIRYNSYINNVTNTTTQAMYFRQIQSYIEKGFV